MKQDRNEFDYDYILSIVSEYNASKEFVFKQKNNLVVRIIAQLPFIANCYNPFANSILNVNTFFLMAKDRTKLFFLHSKNDDSNVLKRLQPLNNFNGGDTDIILQGIYSLALIMLQDYKNDKCDDLKKHKYNPLNYNVWDYDNLHSSILSKIDLENKFFHYFRLEEIISQFFWLDV